MKHIVWILLIALFLASGITLLLFPEPPDPLESVREDYTDAFAMFDKNAERLYHQYGTAAVILLETFQVEGLKVLIQYGDNINRLDSYLDLETIFSLFQTSGEQLENLLDLFQAEIIAEVYARFGEDGLQYLLDDPQIYFLLQQYGEPLIDLANAKGEIVFTLVRKHEPEFLELYYDDVLFTTLSRFGVEGLMALKTYRGKAGKIFELLGDDDRFAAVLRTYGYRQVIPVLYYVYQKQQRATDLVGALLHFKAHQLFESPEKRDPSVVSDEYSRMEALSHALQRLSESGHSFLRQFAISEQGEVQLLPLAAFANLVDIIFVGSDVRRSGFTPAPAISEQSSESAQCERLLSALQVLGLLSPSDGRMTRISSCMALQSGLPEVLATEGVEGLLQLEEYTALMDRYGDAVVPFVARYGGRGIELLEKTHGEILQFSTLYGEEVMHSMLRYGPDVFTLIKTYGEQVLTAIRRTEGEILPYMQRYGSEALTVLNHPHGTSLIALSPVFGEDLLLYAARYPDHFSRYVFKYGSIAMDVFRSHNQQAADLARQYGDDVIYYLGLHGDPALHLIQAGKFGVAILEVLPEDFFLTEGDKPPSTVLEIALALLRHEPARFHQFIGLLGEKLLSVPPLYSQLIFWTVINALLLFILKSVYTLLKRFFVTPE